MVADIKEIIEKGCYCLLYSESAEPNLEPFVFYPVLGCYEGQVQTSFFIVKPIEMTVKDFYTEMILKGNEFKQKSIILSFCSFIQLVFLSNINEVSVGYDFDKSLWPQKNYSIINPGTKQEFTIGQYLFQSQKQKLNFHE